MMQSDVSHCTVTAGLFTRKEMVQPRSAAAAVLFWSSRRRPEMELTMSSITTGSVRFAAVELVPGEAGAVALAGVGVAGGGAAAVAGAGAAGVDAAGVGAAGAAAVAGDGAGAEALAAVAFTTGASSSEPPAWSPVRH